jgi:ketosteroid isomerase-like protein
MSQGNVEKVPPDVEAHARRLFDAWNEHGVAGVTPFWAETIEWHDAPQLPGGGIYRGRDAVTAHIREFQTGEVLDLKLEVEEVRAVGDEVVVCLNARGRGALSGAIVRQPLFYVYPLRDGRIARMRVFMDRAEALEASGLSE